MDIPDTSLFAPVLAEDMGMREWWWLAVLVILALRWFWSNVLKRNQEVEEELEQDDPPYWEDDPERHMPAGNRRSENAPPPLPSGSRPSPAAPPPLAPDPAAELKRFLQELAGAPAQPPPPPIPVVRREPEPPKPLPKVQKPELSREEKAALERIKQRQQHRGRRRSGHGAGLSIHEALRNPDALRNAIVLKEILDEPKALRQE